MFLDSSIPLCVGLVFAQIYPLCVLPYQRECMATKGVPNNEAEKNAPEEDEQLARRKNAGLFGMDTPYAVAEDPETLQLAVNEGAAADEDQRADNEFSAAHGWHRFIYTMSAAT